MMEFNLKNLIYKSSFFISTISGKRFIYVVCLTVSASLLSCNNEKGLSEKEIVNSALQMDSKVTELITSSISFIHSKNGQLNDSTKLRQDSALTFLYGENNFGPYWSSAEKWLPVADSLLDFIEQAKLYGLFPSDYHSGQLRKIRESILGDSLARKVRNNASVWARADLMLSDALVNIFKDLKLGRLPNDSITLRKDSVMSNVFVASVFKEIISGVSLTAALSSLESKHKGYQDLKAGIKGFLAKADFKAISVIEYPDKNQERLKSAVVKRLFESGYLDSVSVIPDSLALSQVLLKYQKERRLTADGKIGPQTIRELNSSDEEKFFRIAITLDRYKMLPEEMPQKYIWVNIPSYTMDLYDGKSIIVNSRVVVGKPKTRTPVLTSSIYEMVTYPQWTIPQSIIVKEILPALKKDPGYLARKGYGLFDGKGEEIDPYSIDWTKYSKGIPYRIIQGSGDANALGILKFNFYNKYAVYLHDTNQRFYFGLDSRALSHGCVRVQEWRTVAYYILENDIEYSLRNKKRFISKDSVQHWLKIQEKHAIPVNDRIPVYIRYFTCAGEKGSIVFFEDIYNEDLEMTKTVFSGKEILL